MSECILFLRLEHLQTKLDDFIESQGHLGGAATGAHAASSAVVQASPPVPQSQPSKQVIQMPAQLDQRLGSLEEKVGSTGWHTFPSFIPLLQWGTMNTDVLVLSA